MPIKEEAANGKEWGYPVDGLIADIYRGTSAAVLLTIFYIKCQ